MTLTRDAHFEMRIRQGSKRLGYLVAIAVNVAMLYVVNNLLAWGWPPFLTEDFDQLLPIVNLSLVVSILVNATYLTFDPDWFKSFSQIGIAVISLAVFIRTLQVFPFDFTAYDFNWETLTRTIVYLGMFGVAIAILVESVKLVRALAARPDHPAG